MIQYPASEESLIQAAALTFTMLRFEQEAAHESHAHSPDDWGRLGVDWFVFLPSWRSTPRADVVPFLAHLPSPALLFPTTRRGVVSLMLLEELSGERRSWAQKTLDNQLAGINQIASQFSPALEGDSKVLLEVSGETHVLPLAVLRVWSQRFGSPVGWSIVEWRDDHRARAQFRLIASDGRVNPPWTAWAPWERPAP